MDELRKIDRDFENFYKTQKTIWKKELIAKKENNYIEDEFLSGDDKITSRKFMLKDQIMSTYLNILEKKAAPVQISSSNVSQCFRVSPYIIKKRFLQDDGRITWEINALRKIQKFPCFPKILSLNMEKREFYMNDVGKPLKSIKSIKELPKDLSAQIDVMIKSLKEVEVFNRDLSLDHFFISKEGRLSLIDWEKCFLSKEDYERNKARNTSSWQKLRYYDMDYIGTMIDNFCKNLVAKEAKEATSKEVLHKFLSGDDKMTFGKAKAAEKEASRYSMNSSTNHQLKSINMRDHRDQSKNGVRRKLVRPTQTDKPKIIYPQNSNRIPTLKPFKSY